MNDEEYVCDCCSMPDRDHEHWCPNGFQPHWDNDPEPEARSREEDRYVEQFGWRRDET